jgi:TspO/MBR family
VWPFRRCCAGQPLKAKGDNVNKVTLAATTLAVSAAAGVGSVASRASIDSWYSRLRKPSYVPPNAVFPVAWTSLYTDIAATSAAAIDRLRAAGRHEEARNYVVALGVNLILNAGWSWLFQVPQTRRIHGRCGGAGGQQRGPGPADSPGRSARRSRAAAVSALVCLCHRDVQPHLGTQSIMRQVAR